MQVTENEQKSETTPAIVKIVRICLHFAIICASMCHRLWENGKKINSAARCSSHLYLFCTPILDEKITYFYVLCGLRKLINISWYLATTPLIMHVRKALSMFRYQPCFGANIRTNSAWIQVDLGINRFPCTFVYSCFWGFRKSLRLLLL